MKEELQEQIDAVSTKRFVCLADAQAEYERFKVKAKKIPYTTEVIYNEFTEEKRPPGRPGKVSKPPVVKKNYTLTINITGVDQELAKGLKEQEECFVLITNVDKGELPTKDVLSYYKDQQVVEVEFRYFKEPCIASVVFLKNPERIRTFMMLMCVALLVRALLQYRLRKGRKSWNRYLPKIGWNGAEMMDNPTVFYLMEMLYNIYYLKDLHGTYELICPGQSMQKISILLEMVGFKPEDLEKCGMFRADRYCFRGAIDDWIELDESTDLKKLEKSAAFI